MSKPSAANESSCCSSNNPFDVSKFFDTSKLFDASKMFDTSKLMDASKAFGEFKMPFANMESIAASQRKNVEALTAANQALFESIQSFARRQTELARQSFESASSTAQAVISAPTPQEKVAKQAEATKETLERSLANVKELTELMAKNQYQAIEMVSNCVSQSLSDLQNLVKVSSAA